MTHELWLPSMFYVDHDERALPSGEVIKWAGTRVLVKVTDEELNEIEGDAKFYSDRWGPDADYLGPLKKSAKRTVQTIARYRARIETLAAIKARSTT